MICLHALHYPQMQGVYAFHLRLSHFETYVCVYIYISVCIYIHVCVFVCVYLFIDLTDIQHLVTLRLRILNLYVTNVSHLWAMWTFRIGKRQRQHVGHPAPRDCLFYNVHVTRAWISLLFLPLILFHPVDITCFTIWKGICELFSLSGLIFPSNPFHSKHNYHVVFLIV